MSISIMGGWFCYVNCSVSKCHLLPIVYNSTTVCDGSFVVNGKILLILDWRPVQSDIMQLEVKDLFGDKSTKAPVVPAPTSKARLQYMLPKKHDAFVQKINNHTVTNKNCFLLTNLNRIESSPLDLERFIHSTQSVRL